MPLLKKKTNENSKIVHKNNIKTIRDGWDINKYLIKTTKPHM